MLIALSPSSYYLDVFHLAKNVDMLSNSLPNYGNAIELE